MNEIRIHKETLHHIQSRKYIGLIDIPIVSKWLMGNWLIKDDKNTTSTSYGVFFIILSQLFCVKV